MFGFMPSPVPWGVRSFFAERAFATTVECTVCVLMLLPAAAAAAGTATDPWDKEL